MWKVKYWQLHNTLLNMIIEGIQKETEKNQLTKFLQLLLWHFINIFSSLLFEVEVVCGMEKRREGEMQQKYEVKYNGNEFMAKKVCSNAYH